MDYEVAHTVLYMQKVNTAHKGVYREKRQTLQLEPCQFVHKCLWLCALLGNTAPMHTARGNEVAKEGCTGTICENTNITIKPLQ